MSPYLWIEERRLSYTGWTLPCKFHLFNKVLKDDLTLVLTPKNSMRGLLRMCGLFARRIYNARVQKHPPWLPAFFAHVGIIFITYVQVNE
jgi:hypothetical protein